MFQNTCNIFANFYALQFYGLTVVTMVLNLAPMITCLVAYPLLGESVACQTIVTLVAAFAAAYLMIMGGEKAAESAAGERTSGLTLFCLLINPFLMSWATITMRQMRRVNEWVPSAAANSLQIFVFFGFMVMQGNNLWLHTTFSLFDWFVVMCCGVCTILAQTFRFQALRNHTASALQPYSFFSPL